jgi:small subunit ribosomal protein S8
MVSDPISDMLTRIRNASLAGRQTVSVPHSRLKVALAKILVQEGYLGGMNITGEAPKQEMILVVRYENKLPVVTSIKRISKPGRRVYIGKSEIPVVVGGVGIAILSTPAGIMTGTEAKKKGIGGELLCEIW